MEKEKNEKTKTQEKTKQKVIGAMISIAKNILNSIQFTYYLIISHTHASPSHSKHLLSKITCALWQLVSFLALVALKRNIVMD